MHAENHLPALVARGEQLEQLPVSLPLFDDLYVLLYAVVCSQVVSTHRHLQYKSKQE